MRHDVIATEYITYSLLYTSTIICNKYVLTSLGFQYPTIFQAWQMLIGLVLMHAVSGFQIKDLVLRDIGPWIPAMVLYVGTIVSGSVALGKLPIPLFILGQGCGDVVLLLCNEKMPSVMGVVSFPIKLSAAIIASWAAVENSWFLALFWLLAHALLSGAYRSVSYWYSTPHWPFSNLTIQQRQYLNYLFAFAVLLPSIFVFGHHQKAKSFLHFSTDKFYIGCVCSGVFGWAANKLWMRVFFQNSHNPRTYATHFISKIFILLLSMYIYAHPYSWSIWIGVLLSLIADALQILDAVFESDQDQSTSGEEMHDVLVSF